MNKLFFAIAIAAFVIIAIAATAYAQQEKKGQKKEQPKQNPAQENQGRGRGQGNQKNQGNQGRGQGNQGNQGQGNQGQGNQGQGNQDNKRNKGQGKVMDREDDNRGPGNAGARGQGRGNSRLRIPDTRDWGGVNVFRWDPVTFRDRDNIRRKDKVTICHKFNSPDEPDVTIKVSANALKAHMDHGDIMGECPQVTNRLFSDVLLRRRTDFFNVIQDSQEQVVYSRSILDYALDRLTNARQQLVVMRNNNVPVAEIERREVVIVQLEQDVSLLERLVGTVAGLVVNRLVN